MGDHLPGAEHARRLVEKHADGRVGVVDDPTSLAALRVKDAHAVPSLDALGIDAYDAILLVEPTRLGALIPTMGRVRDALREGGLAVVLEVVWQTAPTPELARAFAPHPGRERVRPIEAFEMQVEHVGFEIVERVDAPPEAWASVPTSDARRLAVAVDTRGALKCAAWALRKA